MITINPHRTDILITDLTALWMASVKVTHNFLTEEDILKLTPFVKKGLIEIETLIVVFQDERPVAFMGINGIKIEMLFVLPEYFNTGIGKGLVTLAEREYKIEFVDVNELNLQACGFYRHVGFDVFDRTELDEQGNPYPILKMKLRLFSVRRAVVNDAEELRDLFRDTILTVNKQDYSTEETLDWASCGEELSKWEEWIKNHYFIVVQDRQMKIIGFSSISLQGYLNLMYVHKDFQRKCVASTLLKGVEDYAKGLGIKRITSEVSITARPFFEKQGYVVVMEQRRQAKQLFLTNFVMEKSL